MGDARRTLEWLEQIDALLGFGFGSEVASGSGPDSSKSDEIKETVEELILARSDARVAKNWARADEIRAEIEAMGVELKDSAEGTTWQMKTSI